MKNWEEVMTTEEAKLMVERIRGANLLGKLPVSDVALLRKKANRCELESLVWVPVYLFSLLAGTPRSRWDHLITAVMFFGGFILNRVQLARYRKAQKLFEEQGPQMIAELNGETRR
jgi:hypothetical protein